METKNEKWKNSQLLFMYTSGKTMKSMNFRTLFYGLGVSKSQVNGMSDRQTDTHTHRQTHRPTHKTDGWADTQTWKAGHNFNG